ncbi:MAG: hypothetical protein WBD20_02520 [Pirellulaceae bacterium]
MNHETIQPAASDRDGDESRVASPDWSFRILRGVLFAAAAWLLLMPWCPPIAKCTMNRFHLRTGSFPAWAIQQPIPPMYSFANTVQVTDVDSATSTEVIASRTINHFPTRIFTFANGRVRYLMDDHPKWVAMKSTYRGQSVQSLHRLDPPNQNSGVAASWTAKRIQQAANSDGGGK